MTPRLAALTPGHSASSSPFPGYATREHDVGTVVCEEPGEAVRKRMMTILLIDDEESVRMLFQMALAQAGYRVLTAESGSHGLRILQHQEVDLALVDIFMPEMDGLELIPLLRTTRPSSKIIAMSGGSWEWDYLDTAKQLGADDTLKKPFSLQALLDAVSSQLN